MKSIYIVVDPQGLSQAYSSLQEAKDKFEHMIGSCRKNQVYNSTFRSRIITSQVDGLLLKQFQSRYKNNKGFWVNESYSLQQVTL